MPMLMSATTAAQDTSAKIRSHGLRLVSSMQAQTAGFTGEAGMAFRSKLAHLMDDLHDIMHRLDRLAQNAQDTAKKLGAQDQAAAGSIGKTG